MISVIVPVHNTKKFIRECLDSILNQSFKDIEIICVDSSNDGTTDILREYEKEDERIVLIKDENSSYGYKLNIGFNNAKGYYIGIVDSDDYIENNMYERLYEVAEEQQVDFVKSDYSSFFVKNGKNVIFNYEYNAADLEYYSKIFSVKEMPSILYKNAVSIWTGLYKREFLIRNKIFLNESEGASFQDLGFSVLTHVLAGRIYYLKESFYRYRTDNENSSVKSQKKYKVIVNESQWIDKQLQNRGIYDEEILKGVMIKKIISYHWNYERLDREMAQKFCECIHEELLNTYVKKNFNKVMPEYIQKRFEQMYYSNGSQDYNQEVIKNIDSLLRQNSVYLIGAGRLGKKVAEYDINNKIFSIKGIYDNNVNTISILNQNVSVKKVTEVEINNAYLYLIANKNNAFEIKEQLISLGINNIVICDLFPIEKI